MPEQPRDPDRPINEVVIVGAGPAGIGVAAALGHLDIAAVVLDRDDVGASFRRWPEDMRLLTPSFPGNQFGAVDLNAVTPDTSPALTLVEEHPTGHDYARYLASVAELEDIEVRPGTEVTDVVPVGDDLEVQVTGGEPLRARTVVWAAGEAQYPTTDGFPGAELGVPTVLVTSWDDYPGNGAGAGGDEVVVIGGYESGVDAAVNLVARGRRVTVVDRDAPWQVLDADPSRMLSPYTHARLRDAHDTGRLELLAETEVTGIRRGSDGRWHVAVTDVADDDRTDDERTDDADDATAPDVAGEPTTLHADGPPLLATGFDGSLTLVPDRFAFDERGRVVLTEEADESTLVPGLFLAGPMLAHREAIFCFIYKFRQRFAVVAAGIAARLGVDPAPLTSLREHGFYLDDLSCCDDACDC